MKKSIYTLSLVLATLTLTPQAHAAASSSVGNQLKFGIPGSHSANLFYGIMRDLARRAFFEQLAIVRANNPELTDPRELIKRAVEQVAADPERKNPKDPVSIDNFGLSVQDLIQHNLIRLNPRMMMRTKVLLLKNMYIDDLTGIQNIPGIQNVVRLFLNGNLLVTVNASAFKGLDSLGYLELKHNQLQAIEPNAFAGLSNLKQVYLDHNHITSPEEQEQIKTELKALGISVIGLNKQTPLDGTLPAEPLPISEEAQLFALDDPTLNDLD